MRGVNLSDEYDMDGVDEAFSTATGMSLFDLPKILLKYKSLGDEINDRYGSIIDTKFLQFVKDAIDQGGVLDFDDLDSCAHVMFMLSTEEDLKVQDKEEAGKLSKYLEELSNIVEKRAEELEEEQGIMGIKTESIVTESEDTPLGILEGMASALWASSWADHAEEHGCTSMSGQRIEDIMPPIPEEAYVLAKKCADSIEAANGKSLAELFDDAVKADEADGLDSSGADESFGSDLAMQWMGHGVSWFDDHAEFPIKIPHGEAYELQMLADETCDVVDDEDDELDEETKDFLKGLDEASDEDEDLGHNLSTKVHKWMLDNAENHENSTSLAEEAAQVFNLYKDQVDYVIPEIVFEMSAKVMQSLGLEEAKKLSEAEKMYPNESGPNTPWGKADRVVEIARGVKWVSTPSHGGLAVAKGAAEKLLTPAARELANYMGGYYWYEEDQQYSIPFYEHPEWAQITGSSGNKEDFEKNLQKYYPNYFEMVQSGSGGRSKLQPGMKLKFVEEKRWNADWIFKAGDVVIVDKVTPSSIVFYPEGNKYAKFKAPMSYYLGQGFGSKKTFDLVEGSMNEDSEKGWDGLDKDQASSIAKGKSEKDKKTMYAVNHEPDGSYSVGEYEKKKSITVFKGGKEMVEEK